MKFALIARPVSLVALAFVSTAALTDPIGEWRVADGTATIRIHRCGYALCGNVSSTISPAGTDDRNPDPSKRGRSVLGLEVLINMRRAGQNLWAGTTYNADDGQLYDARISILDDGSLKVEGCAPGGGACGSQEWTRVQ
jgi:uncharacterized protein (DUF2147 family)